MAWTSRHQVGTKYLVLTCLAFTPTRNRRANSRNTNLNCIFWTLKNFQELWKLFRTIGVNKKSLWIVRKIARLLNLVSENELKHRIERLVEIYGAIVEKVDRNGPVVMSLKRRASACLCWSIFAIRTTASSDVTAKMCVLSLSTLRLGEQAYRAHRAGCLI